MLCDLDMCTDLVACACHLAKQDAPQHSMLDCDQTSNTSTSTAQMQPPTISQAHMQKAA